MNFVTWPPILKICRVPALLLSICFVCSSAPPAGIVPHQNHTEAPAPKGKAFWYVIFFAIDDLNFSECTKAVCLNGFIKKLNTDYLKAIKEAERILEAI